MTPKSRPHGIPITNEGQVTVPKRVREKLGLNRGDRIVFIERDSEIVVKRYVDAAAFKAALDRWSGILGPLPRGKSVDDLISDLRDGG
jgi:AbrB family looped-hinge helix DNA binding protein